MYGYIIRLVILTAISLNLEHFIICYHYFQLNAKRLTNGLIIIMCKSNTGYFNVVTVAINLWNTLIISEIV